MAVPVYNLIVAFLQPNKEKMVYMLSDSDSDMEEEEEKVRQKKEKKVVNKRQPKEKKEKEVNRAPIFFTVN
jgi:hypothetical protein